jgi:cytochrome c553
MRSTKQRLLELGVLVGLLAVGAAIVVTLGLVPIKASSGHWPITHWLLSFASGRSIASQSALMGIEVPPLNEPGMLRLGAATYESNCAWCHGSPLQATPAVPAAMTPAPPNLVEHAERWKARELFYIAKHGIKFTGMPAWPTQQRDEEIWPVVAFLLALNRISEDEYASLLNRGEALDEPLGNSIVMGSIQNCTACHHASGHSIAGPRVPHLNGLASDYLVHTLRDFRDGLRPSGIMQPIAARLTDKDLQSLAEHFAVQEAIEYQTPGEVPLAQGEVSQDEADLAAGFQLIHGGDKGSKIAACQHCHGPAGESMSHYPSLAGQSALFIEEQLRLYAVGVRLGGEADIMHEVAEKLSPTQRRQVARAYAAMGQTATKLASE